MKHGIWYELRCALGDWLIYKAAFVYPKNSPEHILTLKFALNLCFEVINYTKARMNNEKR